MKTKILFLCTGNSCRSQMAEGWVRHLKSEIIDVWSAGIEKHGINPMAIKVMAELGVDISAQTSKLIDELAERHFDYVITVCDHAQKSCPIFPGKAMVIHKGFDDPPSLTAKVDALYHFRRIRDEIRDYVIDLPQIIKASPENYQL